MLLSKSILLRYLRKTKKSRFRRRNHREDLISDATGIGCSNETIPGRLKRVESISGRRKRVESNNNKVRKKKKMTGNNGGVVDRKDEVDRISELPEPIIHHILSFLHCAKDVARTAVLSRNWKSVFNSYHSFDFDEKWFRESRGGEMVHDWIQAIEVQTARFMSYAENSIATRLEPLVSIDKFRLYVENYDPYMVNWINSAIDKNVKELDIQIHKDQVFVFLPALDDYPSIISLKLSENCPLLEDLRFVCCSALAYISIESLVKLRRVEVQSCPVLFEIEIASSNRLESFWYHAKTDLQCKIDLRDTENLKNLTLKDSMMSDSLLEDWIVRCPSLEKLVLHECTRLEKIKISSEKLKSLALIKCVNLSEASIDTPNLCSLEYTGHTIPFRTMNASRLYRVKLSILPIQIKELHFNIFGGFDGIKSLKLIMYSKQNMKIFEDPREAPQDENSLPKLELTASTTSVLKTVDNWLIACQGKSLTLISSNEELITLISRMIMDREDHRSCCRYNNSNKCWRHYMEDVKVSTLEIGNEMCYDFTWRSRKT
ncbi:hypothetical protein ACS0TY_017392 [Phlomoides rotata]